MKPNQYIQVGRLTNSCLIGANAYRICSGEEEFDSAFLEEITDTVRQRKGHCYMRADTLLDKSELWMVPFAMGQRKLQNLQEVLEYVQQQMLGKAHFYFPFDLIEENAHTAYLIHPIDRTKTVPIRKFMPDAFAERWNMSVSLFRRVLELQQSGLTSNGISREQMRVCPETGEVNLWLNQTISFADGSDNTNAIARHIGFLSLPTEMEKICEAQGISICGTQRDVFSAAVTAFYLIMYTHPFVGSAFYPLLRDDYMTQYHYCPVYIMSGDPRNNLGNQIFGTAVQAQWNRTVPQLKQLFDDLFMAVSDPAKYWKPDADYWKPEKWLEALQLDAQENDNEASHSEYHFANEQYHLV